MTPMAVRDTTRHMQLHRFDKIMWAEKGRESKAI